MIEKYSFAGCKIDFPLFLSALFLLVVFRETWERKFCTHVFLIISLNSVMHYMRSCFFCIPLFELEFFFFFKLSILYLWIDILFAFFKEIYSYRAFDLNLWCSLRVFSVAAVVGICILLPVNYLGDQLQDIDFSDLSNKSLDLFSISNVKDGSNRYLLLV